MKRGRTELKRIDNQINRQVTFVKRKNGLVKKAYELSVLCDAEVALIVFSNRGKLFEFSRPSSMAQMLENYQKCSYEPPDKNLPSKEELETSSCQEYMSLKALYDSLRLLERNFMGEDLNELSSKDLESIERQLASTLKLIRSTRTQVLIDQLSDLRGQEQVLRESYNSLKGRAYGGSQASALQWDRITHTTGHGPQLTQPQSGDLYFHPSSAQTTLQIG